MSDKLTNRTTDRVTDWDGEMEGGGKKKRKSNSGKGVPPMPEDKKSEVKRYVILGEAGQLLSPSPILVRQGVGLELWGMKEETGLIIWPLLLVRMWGMR